MKRILKVALLSASISFAGLGYANSPTIVDPNYNLIFDAISVGNVERLDRVVKSDKLSLNHKDSKGSYPIYYAIDREGDIFDFFIDEIENVSLSVSDKNGLNPLNYAIKNNKYNAVIKMLNRGVNPTIKDANSKTAFHYAVDGDNNIKMIFKEYAANNPDIAKKFMNGESVESVDKVAKVEDVVEVKSTVKSPESLAELKGVVNTNLYEKFKIDFGMEIEAKLKADLEAEMLAKVEDVKKGFESDLSAARVLMLKDNEANINKEKEAAKLVLADSEKEYKKVVESKDLEIETMYSVFSELTSVEVDVLKGIIKKQLD